MPGKMKNIRNFSIIAHIDHGKSTLADRIIEKCRLVDDRNKVDQMLDTMDIDRERGITSKANAITLKYSAKNVEDYIFNLIDTPGHVDFAYEVSRALASCDGVLLVVDATQGVEAQTIANLYLAMENDLEIIPVINKIDMPAADVEKTKHSIEKTLGLDADHAVAVSAKEGINIEELLEKIVEYIPAPKGDINKPLSALIFDSYFDKYVGTVVKVRIYDGEIKKDDVIKMVFSGREYTVNEVGVFRLNLEKRDKLLPGEVGYVIANIKSVTDTKIGDTITLASNPCAAPLKGFRDAKPMVFAGRYPMFSDEDEALREALAKLKLNDASLLFEPDNSYALGFGFRCGFLGLLHMEIIQERLEREYEVSLVITAPSVEYRITTTDGSDVTAQNAAEVPDPSFIRAIKEPWVKVDILTPQRFMGPVMELCQQNRGLYIDTRYFGNDINPQFSHQLITYELPLMSLLTKFFDQLKSLSSGYASLDYEIIEFRPADIVKVSIIVNKEEVPSLAFLETRENAPARSRKVLAALKETIPRHQFSIALQAAVGGKIVAREDISAMRKDVTAPL